MRAKQYMMKIVRLSLIVCLIIGTSLSAANVTLHNYSQNALWVYMKRVGLKGVKWLVKDVEEKLEPGKQIERSGNIPEIWVLPMDQPMSLDEFKEKTKMAHGDPKNVLRTLCDIAQRDGLYQRLGDGNWFLSFDRDQRGKSHLYFGKFRINQPFTFLQISDMHTIAKNEAELQKRHLKHYGGDAKRESHLKEHRAKVAVRNMMLSYVNDASKNIQSIIIPGDGAGGYGKKSDTDAYKTVWHAPFQEALKVSGGHVFVGFGNHDTYWSSITEPYPTAMLRFIKRTYGDYLYSFNIGLVRFIHLGLHPTFGRQRDGEKLGDRGKGSIQFLASEFKMISKQQPVIIFFHYPIHGFFSDWWSKADKNAFYETIKEHNVIAILVGHAHRSALFKFRNKIPVICAAGNEFAECIFNPQTPNELSITFVDAKGTRTPGQRRLKKDTIETDLKSSK